ncbi:MAG: AI-2E family transporter [Bacilli bacterium]|nr:AI-2E family transporter [Bacilli bacterium]MDD4607777.1 AI-2E family transporter [Bacilli bacterium]
MEKKKKPDLDVRKLNDILGLGNRILKIVYFLFFILSIYVVLILTKELHIVEFVLTILTIVSPLFIGLIIAWLFDPFVKWLNKKGIKRFWGTCITYFIILSIIYIVVATLVPLLSEQINDFAQTLPQVFNVIEGWIDNIFNQFDGIKNFNAENVKLDLFAQIEAVGINLTNSLPTIIVDVAKSIFSGLGVIIVGLIIGFYLLISFDGTGSLIGFLPKKIQKTTVELVEEIDNSLRSFVQGALLDCTFVFIITSIGLWFIGLKAPLLFGLFCGLTNIIPYAGPYIGGAPAVIVGFSQDPMIGLLTLILIFIIQFLEGNLIQPLIMSHTTKLHPVTIMLGLLIFGYFWGIIGMIISTPVIAACKAIIMFYDEKYDILHFK